MADPDFTQFQRLHKVHTFDQAATRDALAVRIFEVVPERARLIGCA